MTPRTPLLVLPLLVLASLAPSASAAATSERYVGFDSGYTATVAEYAALGCNADVNLGNACFVHNVNAHRSTSVTIRVRDDAGAAVPFGVIWWYGDGTGLTNLVLYCGDATLSTQAPASGIVAVSVTIWGGHPAGTLCPLLTNTGVAYVPGLPGTVTFTK